MNDAVTPTAGRKQISWLSAALLGIAAILSLTTCSPSMNTLERVRQSGTLRVATINSPTTYYIGPHGPTGFDHDLAVGLARQLDVRLVVQVAPTAAAALALVRSGQADVAAASLDVSALRQQRVRYSRPILSVVPQVVYRLGAPKPRSLDAIAGKLVVPAESPLADRLARLKEENPTLSWTESTDDAEDLLEKVATGEIEYTVANSDLVSINQRYYPRLRVAFALTKAQNIAWAFSHDRDTSFYDETQKYLNSIRTTELARLRDRHFGHIEQVDLYGATTLAQHVRTRLPLYREAFQREARKLGMDWRLLAAVGYQESHWDPTAISPTGVRGLMQLSLQTAEHLKVADREDPMQSIVAGSAYLRTIINSLPKEIVEPDRTWLALAAYNMGMGHLSDVRKLTARRGGDSTRWLDIRNSLPLLGQPKWYQMTQHGYAPGRQAAQYVGNVRTYYDMLVWLTETDPSLKDESPVPAIQAHELQIADRPARDAESILRIRTPIL